MLKARANNTPAWFPQNEVITKFRVELAVSGLGIRNLLDGNGECSGVDGRAASSGDGEGVGSGGGVEGLGTGGPATAAGTSAGDDRDQAGKEADGEKEQLSANEVARPCGGAPNSATAGADESE
jgi:hypothetical protein